MERTRLRLAAIFFAIIWTGLMIWWTGPQGVAHAVIWSISGAIAGVLWYWFMRKWADRHVRRDGV